jgi:hypothetical protein
MWASQDVTIVIAEVDPNFSKVVLVEITTRLGWWI